MDQRRARQCGLPAHLRGAVGKIPALEPEPLRDAPSGPDRTKPRRPGAGDATQSVAELRDLLTARQTSGQATPHTQEYSIR